MLYKIIEKAYKQIPLKYQQRLKDLELENLKNMRIEFTNGIVQKTFNYEILTNKISLIQTSTVIKEFLRILLKMETLPIFILIYLLSTLELLWSEVFIVVYTMVCLILDMFISFYLLFVTLRTRWKFEDQINKQKCMVFADLNQLLQAEQGSPYTIIDWQDVKIGQIICLQKGERSPADLLILDSCQEQVTVEFLVKYSCPCTFVNENSKTKGVMTKFLVNLSGWVQFQSLNLGTIKLKNDPKITQFTNENIIHRGQLLSHSDWIFGMAIQVGHGCFSYRDKYYNWNSINQNSFFIFLIEITLIGFLLIPKLIYSASFEIEQYQNSLLVCLLLFPSNYFWLNQVWNLFNQFSIKNPIKNDPTQPPIQEYPVQLEYEDRVLIQVQKILSTHHSVSCLPTIKPNCQMQKIDNYCQLSNQNILELMKTDVIIFENPQKMIKQNIRVNILMQEKNKYYFNYDKLLDLISKVTPTQKHNYEKLLLDTNRFSAYDEQKTLDVDLLLAEKQIPTLRIEDETKQVQKLGFLKNNSKSNFATKEMKDSKDLKKSNGDSQKLNPYASFRKQSARNLFQSQNNLAQQQQNQTNSLALYQNSPKLQRQKSNNQINASSQSILPKSQVSSLKNILPSQQDLSSDQIVGDALSETDFFGKLFNKQDNISNELLIMMLLCNDVQSVYDSQSKQLQNIYSNFYDQAILDFAKICEYRFICSTLVDNNKIEYKQDEIIKKAVSIQGVVKIFDIIALLQPTQNRQNVISVLVKDPESFELEEGTLLYTRVETNESNEKDQRYQNINEVINEMFWDGTQSFVYFKQQLNSKQTEQFLTKLNSINETYGNREEELEKLYLSYEQESTLFYVLGLKQHLKVKNQLSSQELYFDGLKKEKLFQTLLKNNYKICFVTNTYKELITFVRTYRVVDKSQIEHFIEVNTLHFKFRQHLQDLIDKDNILEVYQIKSIDNFIIINDETLEAIIKDEYLKYHFVVIFYFSQGIGAYNLDEKQKGKLLKLLQITERYITTIGPGLDNQYFFYKSNFSFNLVDIDPQCALANPHFLVKKIQEIFKLLYYYCPITYLNYEALILVQIYRCMFFGFLCYVIDYQNSISILENFIIFYTVPSNIVTCLLNYQQFMFHKQFQGHIFDISKKQLDQIKRSNIYSKICKVIAVAIIDGVIVEVCFTIFNAYYLSQIQEYSLFLYIIVEFTEKQKYLLMKFDSCTDQLTIIRQCIATVIFLLLLIIVYGLTTADIMHQFNSINFIYWIFGFIFSLSITFLMQENLILTDFCLPCLSDLTLQITHQKDIEKWSHSLKYLYSQSPNEAKQFIEKLFEGKDFMDEILVKKIKGDQQMTDQMDRGLKFSDKRTEKDFLNFLKPQQQYTYIVYEFAILGIRIYQQIENLYTPYLVIALIEFFVISLISTIRISKFQPLISLGLRFVFFIVLRCLIDTQFIEVEMFLIAFAVAHHPSWGIFAYYGVCLVSIVLDLCMTGVYNDGNPYYILKHGFILIEICVPLMAQVYKTEFLQRYQYVLQNKLSDEYKKLNDALGLLMPRFIKERMSKGQIQISEDQGDVAILFCDIYEFDDVIKNEQIRVVDFLDNLYRQFDQFCQANELQKIETVGKTYMAAGGLKEYNISTNLNPTERILDTALQMVESVKTMKYGDNKAVILKIGIHYGRVIAGVIGAHKPQFSLIGDTVNTTSRVCSTSEPGVITLSQQAYEKVNNQKYSFKLREVEAKGKGTIKTYQLIKTSKKQEIQVRKKAEDISKSPNPRTPKLMIKQIQRNLQGKRKTIMKKVSFSEDKQGNPFTVQNTNANAKLIVPQVPTQLQPMIRASSRSVFNSSYQMQLLTPKEDQDNEKDQNNNNNNEIHLNNIQDEGLQSSIPLGGGGPFYGGQVNKNKIAKASGLNQMKQKRKSIYQKAATRTNFDQDPILGMATGGQKLAESVKMELPKVKKLKSIKQVDFIDKVESLSHHQTPKELRGEKMDELEIRKLQLIQKFQNEDDIKTMEEKVEVEQFGIQESDYKSENHDLYFTIYDQYKDYHYKQIKITMTFVVCLLIIKNLLYLFISKDTNFELLILIICQSVICLLLFIVITNLNRIDIVKWMIGFYFIIFSIINILIVSIHNQNNELVFELSQIGSVYLNIYYLQVYSQKERIKLSTLFLLIILIMLLYHDYIVQVVLFSLSVVIMSFIAQYQEIQILAENYQYYSQFQSKNAKQTQILQYLLPQHIIGRFFSADVNTTDSFTDVFEDCTILFADIAGFTKYSSSVEAEQVVNMLRTLYQQFDEACQKFQVYKLYTIGDCYVCIGIIDANNRDPIGEAINIVLFGLKMIEIIQQINKDPQFQHLNMRIGAHTGRVIGGVVGTDVVRYDIYGEDVTIANKMESKGQEGKIMVSQATKDLIESDRECIDIFDFEFSQDVFLPQSNTTISTYFVHFDQIADDQ